MDASIHYMIKNEYEKRQRDAFNDLMKRREVIYSQIPSLREIDEEIKRCGIRYNKMILQGGQKADSIVAELHSTISLLRSKKQALLAQHGYPQNYLETVYKCPACKDTGFIDNGNTTVKCSCYRQQLINHLYAYSNLNLAESGNFSAFDEGYYSDTADEARHGISISPRENILYIKDACKKFIDNFNCRDERNLFFCGPAGTGKTFMSHCIASELLNREITVLYQTAPVLFNRLNDLRFRSAKENGDSDAVQSNIFNVELLIIDDLGTEPPSPSRYAELLTILNTRKNNSLLKPCKTIISTNISVKDLYTYYDERIASRIIGDFTILKFAGDDIRRLKKLEKSTS